MSVADGLREVAVSRIMGVVGWIDGAPKLDTWDGPTERLWCVIARPARLATLGPKERVKLISAAYRPVLGEPTPHGLIEVIAYVGPR